MNYPVDNFYDLERQLFTRGRELLGKNAGGLIVKLLKISGKDVALARSRLEMAATKDDPKAWLAKTVHNAMIRLTATGYAQDWELRARSQQERARQDEHQEQRRRRPTMDELRAKWGPNWGIRL